MKEHILDTLKLIAMDIPTVARKRVVAGIVHRNKLLSVGVCSYDTHPLSYKFSKDRNRTIHMHAEVDAIKNYLKKHKDLDFLSSCSMYVVRMRIIDGKFVTGLAKPCEGCARAIRKFGIRNVEWTEDG